MCLPFRFDFVQVKNLTGQEEFSLRLRSPLTIIAVNANLHVYDKHVNRPICYKLMQFRLILD